MVPAGASRLSGVHLPHSEEVLRAQAREKVLADLVVRHLEAGDGGHGHTFGERLAGRAVHGRPLHVVSNRFGSCGVSLRGSRMRQIGFDVVGGA